jgi:hypothetical protein
LKARADDLKELYDQRAIGRKEYSRRLRTLEAALGGPASDRLVHRSELLEERLQLLYDEYNADEEFLADFRELAKQFSPAVLERDEWWRDDVHPSGEEISPHPPDGFVDSEFAAHLRRMKSRPVLPPPEPWVPITETERRLYDSFRDIGLSEAKARVAARGDSAAADAPREQPDKLPGLDSGNRTVYASSPSAVERFAQKWHLPRTFGRLDLWDSMVSTAGRPKDLRLIVGSRPMAGFTIGNGYLPEGSTVDDMMVDPDALVADVLTDPFGPSPQATRGQLDRSGALPEQKDQALVQFERAVELAQAQGYQFPGRAAEEHVARWLYRRILGWTCKAIAESDPDLIDRTLGITPIDTTATVEVATRRWARDLEINLPKLGRGRVRRGG